MQSHLKAYRAHRALAIFYGLIGVVFCAVMLYVSNGLSDLELIIPLVFCLGVSAVHAWTARACKQGRTGGRRASIAIAVPMLAGFPIGTLIALYLLANSWNKWNTPLDGA